jgi:hypothetical protein
MEFGGAGRGEQGVDAADEADRVPELGLLEQQSGQIFGELAGESQIRREQRTAGPQSGQLGDLAVPRARRPLKVHPQGDLLSRRLGQCLGQLPQFGRQLTLERGGVKQ